MSYKRRALEAEAKLNRLKELMHPDTTRRWAEGHNITLGNEEPVDLPYLTAVNIFQQKRTIVARTILEMDVPL